MTSALTNVDAPLGSVALFEAGAAADNGFHGLGGRFVRHGLLQFEAGSFGGEMRYRFERVSNGESVTLAYDASMIPPTVSTAPASQVIL